MKIDEAVTKVRAAIRRARAKGESLFDALPEAAEIEFDALGLGADALLEACAADVANAAGIGITHDEMRRALQALCAPSFVMDD